MCKKIIIREKARTFVKKEKRRKLIKQIIFFKKKKIGLKKSVKFVKKMKKID